MLAEEAWAMCFVAFGFGDSAPNMRERGRTGNGTVYVPMEDIFERLQDREELELQTRCHTRPERGAASTTLSARPSLAVPFAKGLSFEVWAQSFAGKATQQT